MSATVFPAIAPVNNDGTLIQGLIVDRQGYPSGYLFLDWAASTGSPSAATASVKVYSNTSSAYAGATLLATLETAQDIKTAGAESYYLDLTSSGRYIFVEFDSTYTLGTVPANIVSASFNLDNGGIVEGFTTLAAVKLEAGITDTASDALFEALITSVSSAMRVYLNREITRTTHTSELYSVNACQYLYLKEFPVQAVSSVTLNGAEQTVNVDYWIDAGPGRLYRPAGWIGNYYTRGTFPDIFAGARDVSVTYTAGWYLPADPLYVAGASSSLPMALSYACNRAVVSRYRTILNQADGVKQYSEGGISTTWFGPEAVTSGGAGFDAIALSMMAPYKRRDIL